LDIGVPRQSGRAMRLICRIAADAYEQTDRTGKASVEFRRSAVSSWVKFHGY
jgi:hypothetical protein